MHQKTLPSSMLVKNSVAKIIVHCRVINYYYNKIIGSAGFMVSSYIIAKKSFISMLLMHSNWDNNGLVHASKVGT